MGRLKFDIIKFRWVKNSTSSIENAITLSLFRTVVMRFHKLGALLRILIIRLPILY